MSEKDIFNPEEHNSIEHTESEVQNKNDNGNFPYTDDYDYHLATTFSATGEASDTSGLGYGDEKEVTPIFKEDAIDPSAPESIIDEIPAATNEPSGTSSEPFFQETIKNEYKTKRKDKFVRAVAITCIASLIGGGSLGFGIGAGFGFINRGSQTEKKPFAFENTASPVSTNGYTATNDLAPIVKKVMPSVVCITSSKQVDTGFFNMPEESGAGSGIIFEQDNEKVYIVTNYHVVQGANKVGVVIGSADSVPAKLVGREAASDLAVISIDKSELAKVNITDVTLAQFGDSDAMSVGEPVIAIGNALGEGITATSGILSAKDKTIVVEDKELQVIQTDAAINPGNSGGALVNLKGEVIGINTAKFSRSSVEGMGYSISSDIAKPTIERLMNKESKAYLGIKGRTIDEKTAELYNLPGMGVYVAEVVPESSADLGGLKASDIITSFNGSAVLKFEDLSKLIEQCKVEDTIKVKIIRDGKEPMDLTITLKALPENEF